SPQSDLADVDIRRFGTHTANKKALAERTGETLGLHYAMRWPRQELETARPLRTSPLYDLLAAKGASFGAKNGWERANYFREASAVGTPAYPHALDKPAWLADVGREQRATRHAVALYDQTSFGKMLLQGRDALAVLQRLCANEMDVAPGRMVYTPMLNERGGFESDVTVTRLAVDRFLIVTGSAQAPRDHDWITRHIGAGEAAALVDVSAMSAVLSLMGPNARTLLARVGARDSYDALGPEHLKFATTREIDLGHARVRAARMSYVGGPGYELYVPIETAPPRKPITPERRSASISGASQWLPPHGTAGRSLDHDIGLVQHRLRHRDAEAARCLEVDDELELGRLLDRDVAGPSALQDPVDV